MQDTYFAAEPYYSDEYLNACLDKIDSYREYCQERGLIDLWQRALKNYYGISADGMKLSSQVSRSGDEGEQLTIKINDYRNLIQHQPFLHIPNRICQLSLENIVFLFLLLIHFDCNLIFDCEYYVNYILNSHLIQQI